MISLTVRAAQEVHRIVAEQSLSDSTVLRVGVKGGGCSGFSYSLGFDDTIRDTDQIIDGPKGIQVVCDPKSFLYLNNTEIDFEESLMGRGFKFGNPNASKTCGCGESFTV